MKTINKISKLALPLCFLLIPCCYILIWTVTEVYYFRKSTSSVIEKKPETIPNEVRKGILAFKAPVVNAPGLYFSNFSGSNLKKPHAGGKTKHARRKPLQIFAVAYNLSADEQLRR